MKDLLLKFYTKAQALRDDRGQDMVEYALVVGVIALGAFAVMGDVSTSINGMFTAVKTKVDTAAASLK
jgi:Flp pilus assembly pilin Flp